MLRMLRLRHSNAGRQLGRIGLKPIGLDQHGLCADMRRLLELGGLTTILKIGPSVYLYSR